MRRPCRAGLATILLSAFAAMPALAYVGPGAGLSVLGALWGVLIAVFLALGFLLIWPFRRYLFARRARRDDRGKDGENGSGQASGAVFSKSRRG